MARAFRRYQRHIHQQLNRLATWLPGDRLAPGDVGLLSKGSFRKETDLDRLGIPFELELSEVRPTLSCSSKRELSFDADASAKLADQQTRARLVLARAGAVIFEVRDVQQRSIANLAEVGRAVLSRHAAGDWSRDWVLIDQVWTAGQGTVLVALDDRTELTLVGQTPAPGQLEALTLAGNLELLVEAGEVVGELAGKQLTPLYTARKINWLGNKLATRGDGLEPALELDWVHLDDLLASA